MQQHPALVSELNETATTLSHWCVADEDHDEIKHSYWRELSGTR